MDAKLHYVGLLQEFHSKTNFDSTPEISALFLEKPKRRADAAAKNMMSLLDLAELPSNTPDEKIIKLIASEMSKAKETKMTLSDWKTYTNEFLMYDSHTKKLIGLSHTAIEKFNFLLNQELRTYQQNTGKTIPEQFFEIHKTPNQGAMQLKSTEEILCFIRKTPIINHPELGESERVLYKAIVCRILKKMLAVEDYLQHKTTIDESRKTFDQYVTTEITKTFYHSSPISDPIEDKSHVNYFSDKEYLLNRQTMKTMGITYEHDIKFHITKRAKSENSIVNKTIFDPELNSAEAAKDIGGIRFLNKNPDPEKEKNETNILWYYMTRLYNNNNFAGNDDLNDAYPQGNDISTIGKEYSKDDIADMVKYMHMDMKDKDILKIKTIRERSETAPALYELDKEWFDCYGCKDKFVIAQMNAVVEKKNQDAKKVFDLSKKTTTEAKLDLFKEVVKEGHPVYEHFLQNDEKLEILYWCAKKFADIKKRFAHLKKILSLSDEITDLRKEYNSDPGVKPIPKREVLKPWNGSTFSYRDEQNIDRTLTVEDSKIEKLKTTAYYKHDDAKGFYVDIAGHKILFTDLELLDREFLEKWKESSQNPQNYNNKDKGARKGSGSSTRIDGKNQGRMYTQSGQYFLGEHQFMPQRAIQNIKPMTVSEIYQYVKQIFVTLRLEQLITKQEIITMVQKSLIPTIQSKIRVENTMTGAQLLEAIVKDDEALPIGGTIEEKFMHELVTDRDLRPLIIGGKIVDDVFIYPKFEKRRKRNHLGLDNMNRPQEEESVE